MKKRYLLSYIVILCFFTGCGDTVGRIEYSVSDVVPVMANVSSEDYDDETEMTETEINYNQPEDVVFQISENIEVYEKIKLCELITYTNAEIENADEIVNTDETGIMKTKVFYKYQDNYYENDIEYTVVDTVAPVVLNYGGGSIVKKGEIFDLNNYVGFADNYDSAPLLTYEGIVDTGVCGIYPVNATATDSSGNSTSWELDITVSEEIPEPEDNNERIYFQDFITQYEDENVRFGIDVSKWQGEIDFEAVKNAGCSFVIMRIGSYYDEYGHTLDDYYTSNMEKAKEAGLDVGIYIYTTANTEEKIKNDAKWISEILNETELDFPVVFDWESFSNFQKYEMSINDLNSLFKLFADEMKIHGYPVMLYSSKNFLNNFWYDDNECPIWLAHYTEQTDYEGEYSMWQMTCYGRIDGIDTDVDFNILYMDMPM